MGKLIYGWEFLQKLDTIFMKYHNFYIVFQQIGVVVV